MIRKYACKNDRPICIHWIRSTATVLPETWITVNPETRMSRTRSGSLPAMVSTRRNLERIGIILNHCNSILFSRELDGPPRCVWIVVVAGRVGNCRERTAPRLPLLTHAANHSNLKCFVLDNDADATNLNIPLHDDQTFRTERSADLDHQVSFGAR